MTLLDTTPTTYRLGDDAGAVREYPRVTSILSLVRSDLRDIPPEVLHRAAERGKAVHRACWILCADPSGLHWPSLHPDLRGYVEAFQAFQKATGCRVLQAEQLVVSERYGYAGRADLFVEGLSRYLDCVDIKSGVEHPSHALQTAAYRMAYIEMTGTRRSVARWGLYLRDDGSYRLVSHLTGEADFKVFCALLTAWRWQQANGGQA